MAALDRQQIMQQYPTLAWTLDVPEIADIISGAIKAGSSQDELLAKISNTDWWKQHGPAYRNYLQLQQTDPEGLNERIRQQDASVWDLNTSTGAGLSGDEVDHLARQSIQLGWNADQIKDALVAASRQKGYQGQQGNLGAIATTVSTLKQQASQYMVNIDDNTAYQWATSIAAGEKNPEDYNVMFQEWAKSRFPTLSQYIDKGITPESYFAPYKQTMAQLLEVSPDSIDLTSPKWSQVVDKVDEKTQQRRPMTLNETQQMVRGTRDWQETRNGQEAGAALTNSLLQTFGKVAS